MPAAKEERTLAWWVAQTMRLPVAELIVTTALFLVLYFPLAKKDLGEIVAVVGILLMVARIAYQEALKERLRRVDQLAEIVDLSQQSRVRMIDSILKAYISITEPEFSGVKNHILAEASERLRKIASERKSGELSTGAYYSWLIPILQDVKRGEAVRAVSLMHDVEWDDSEPERKFFQENVNLVRRGAILERIFIMPRAEWPDAFQNEKIKAHARGSPFGLTGWFVDLDHLRKKDAGLLDRVGNGFIEIGSRVALIDRFTEDGQARGHVTMDEGDLRRLGKIFEELKVYGAPFDLVSAKTPHSA